MLVLSIYFRRCSWSFDLFICIVCLFVLLHDILLNYLRLNSERRQRVVFINCSVMLQKQLRTFSILHVPSNVDTINTQHKHSNSGLCHCYMWLRLHIVTSRTGDYAQDWAEDAAFLLYCQSSEVSSWMVRCGEERRGGRCDGVHIWRWDHLMWKSKLGFIGQKCA